MKIVRRALLLGVLTGLTGCPAAGQPVEWSTNGSIVYYRGFRFKLKAAKGVDIPADELRFLKEDIWKKVSQVMDGYTPTYLLRVTITRYDEGYAGARYFLPGAGLIVHASVVLTERSSGRLVRKGYLKKVYDVHGIAGATATIRNNVLPKIGDAIAEGLREPANR